MRKHVSIRISGLVQGVYFRASTKETADAMNISGFVRNERDGTVYVEAEGEEDDIRNFIAWCRRGPALAKVEACEVTEGQMVSYSRFVVTR